jgi:chorismate synthase
MINWVQGRTPMHWRAQIGETLVIWIEPAIGGRLFDARLENRSGHRLLSIENISTLENAKGFALKEARAQLERDTELVEWELMSLEDQMRSVEQA